MSNRRRVVVTRQGVVSPLGNSIAEFEANLFAGNSGIREMTRLDSPDFEWFEHEDELPVRVAGEVDEPDLSWMGKERNRVGRFTKYALAAARQAIDERLFLPSDNPYRAGMILGTGAGGQEEAEIEQTKLLKRRRINKVSSLTVCKRMPNACSGKLAQIFELCIGGLKFKIRGDNYVTSSACASSSHAIGETFRKVRDGYLDVAVTGGAGAPITPMTVTAFYRAGALTTNPDPTAASRPFDLHRDGFVMGEGAGILVLESLEHALGRGAEHEILAEIVGYKATDDAYHDTQPHPEAEGAYMAMLLALEDAAMKPEDIGYINAHGTSTIYNDKAETLAVKRLFDHDKGAIPPMSSTKSQIGHLIGAAGAVELIATILALQRKTAPPTINYSTFDPECDLDYVPNKARPLPNLEAALSNSFGFTGHNASIAVKEYKR